MSDIKAVYINHGKVIGGAPNQLDNLSDVSINAPAADQILGYDAITGVWSNKSVPAPAGKADKVDGATNGDLAALDATGNLTDSGVKLNITSPTSGQALTYDATNQVFVNSDIPSPEGKADKVDEATSGNIAGLDNTGNLTDSGIAADDIIVKSDTAGLVKNDGTVDTNTYLTSTDISTVVTTSATTGLIKNDGTIDTNTYLVSNDISNVIVVSDTAGLVKNDGTIDTNSYLTSTDISTMVTTSDTTGLIKNDGTIDTNTYLVSADISNVLTISDTTGLVKNDGTIDTNTYVQTSEIGTAAAKDSINAVTADSTSLVESGAVKSAIDAAISSVYKPSGDKTVAELLPELLTEGNLGNVYNITDSGTTTEYFREGSGHPIPAGSNVVIIDLGTASSHNYKFDLLSGFIDLTNYIQKSSTVGLVKNDGTIDTNIYLVSNDISNVVTTSATTGLIKNDGTIDTNTYLTSNDITGKVDKVTGTITGNIAGLDSTTGNITDSGIKVTVTTPTVGQALMYDSTNSVWTNQTVPSPEGKADKVNGAVSGNLAALDGNGNLTDSGVDASDFLTVISGATSGNLVSVDSNGQLQDSGIDASDFLTVVSGAVTGNFATFTVDGQLQDSGLNSASFATTTDISTLQTALYGVIPINPDNTTGMNIWIETE